MMDTFWEGGKNTLLGLKMKGEVEGIGMIRNEWLVKFEMGMNGYWTGRPA
jgi:hypothetical protein